MQAVSSVFTTSEMPATRRRWQRQRRWPGSGSGGSLSFTCLVGMQGLQLALLTIKFAPLLATMVRMRLLVVRPW